MDSTLMVFVVMLIWSLCYNGDFESVELENFGGVDNYYFYPPLGVFFPQSFHYNIGANLMGFESCPENSNIGVINSVLLLQACCWVDMLQGRNLSMISPLHEALLWPQPLPSQMINDHRNMNSLSSHNYN
ncbi:hypothetical protein GBA52_001079 [Prunus armeniaca]|nr:hypothetical protein GBA52_001079 [Prunus armeniaca]